MTENVELVKLQLAMAFGQGAGSMLAETDALKTLLDEDGDILKNAMGNWKDSQWAFVELMRVLGQHASASACAAGHWRIKYTDLKHAIPAVMVDCPCVDRLRRPLP